MIFGVNGEVVSEMVFAMTLKLQDQPGEAVVADVISSTGSSSPGWGNAGRGGWFRGAPRNF